ncbi:acetyltransferase (GNAT) family domain-containing protein [Ditylenchus destructor]|uniref:Acetyltransferase (GNAT) family domain-containing protein n=1 Tax=Ditylenchus destructor TaxID=166010 RepID=A0AAD4MPK0_9BILA|nr:acetyltransferase (GNAT) family domain-containing protein [Ditylenchus destructor]
MADPTTEFIIRSAVPNDAPQIRELIQDLANFIQMSDGPKISAEQLAKDMEAGLMKAFIAHHRETSEVAAMLIHATSYGSWIGPYAIMDDLYVREKFRRKGLSRTLMAMLAVYCLENNITVMKWTVRKWNKIAIDFYNKIGAVDLCDKAGTVCYKLNEPEMRSLANGGRTTEEHT